MVDAAATARQDNYQRRRRAVAAARHVHVRRPQLRRGRRATGGSRGLKQSTHCALDGRFGCLGTASPICEFDLVTRTQINVFGVQQQVHDDLTTVISRVKRRGLARAAWQQETAHTALLDSIPAHTLAADMPYFHCTTDRRQSKNVAAKNF